MSLLHCSIGKGSHVFASSSASMFSDSESDNESLHRLTINEHYAKAFEYRKEREELDKCTFHS